MTLIADHRHGELLSPADAARVQEALDNSISDATKTAYASDWRAFTGWCSSSGYRPMPALAETVIAYLTFMASAVRPDGRHAYAQSTIVRRASSINAQHVAAGMAPPGADGRVTRALKAIKRYRTQPQRRVAPLLTGDVRLLLEGTQVRTWPDGIGAVRDAALLLAGFAGAFRRSELAALKISDVIPDLADGVYLRVRRSKTDQEGQGQIKGLPYGVHPLTCAPCAIYRWMDLLDAAEGPDGRPGLMRALRKAGQPTSHICRDGRHQRRSDNESPLFRSLAGGGVIKPKGMTGHAVSDVIKRRAAAAGLDPNQYAGHSLRAGFVTQAFKSGADSRSVRRQTGHTGDAILAVYDRENAPLEGNAVRSIGL
ncbi:site-specific integrase [Arthrobacter caoxuetaonis]|uniref:Site-specific integrase n=1 Tax=Arthrobacter caoxuetaonis TaxID=2886935 RepID=A0A9X1MGL5_9MICC|nr:tyrosine-type recombinase/integrase [Arthrobacter caoxuetaonis]MCC3299693.1 site-specific integrase [Arthrobacter caoxuetaonis]USQ58966.1 site-specific integrase [Arthrobacter caoxuetaonis]